MFRWYQLPQNHHLSPSEESVVRGGLDISLRVFSRAAKPRNFGPALKGPILLHLVQVTLDAMKYGTSLEIIVAAALHDILERYIPGVDPATVDEEVRRLLHPLVERYYTSPNGMPADNEKRFALQRQVERFINRVMGLVTEVSEEPKTNGHSGFWPRKNAFLENLERASANTLTLALILKIDALHTAIRYLRETESLKGWSAGSYRDNLRFFSRLGELFRHHKDGLPPKALEDFERLIETFSSFKVKED